MTSLQTRVNIAIAFVAVLATNTYAVQIQYSGSTYEVSTIVGTYDGLVSTLDQQVWFGNATAAEYFAMEVDNDLGAPNNGEGPFFADVYYQGFPGGALPQFGAYVLSPNGQTGHTARYTDVEYTFAVAQEIPIPAAAWLFGSGLLGLVGMARRKKTS